MKVRALQECYQGGSRRMVGAEFDVPEGTKLRTKKMSPVMELVDPPPEPAPPPRKVPKRKPAKEMAVAPEEPAED